MRSPSSWSRVLRLTYAAVLPLYFACGLLGYAAYGDFANANINVNFPDNLANQASIVVQMVQEVRLLRSTWPRHHARLTLTPTFTTRHSPLATHHSPLHLHPHQVYFLLSTNLVIMLALELRLGLDPAACCSPRWNGCPWLGRLPLPPWVGRLVLRSALLSSQVLDRVRVRRRSSLGSGFVADPRAAAGCIGLQPRAPRPAPPILSLPPGAVTPRVLPGYHPMATGPRGTAAALGRG